ncbi:MAG: NAD(P)H-dependent glycerol-3-phosphate dehydrogenase [Pseudomonadota bacterium]
MMPHAILVVGAGSWGTALAILLSRNGHKVTLWGRDQAHVQSMQMLRTNQRYLPDAIFPEELHPDSSITQYLSTIQDLVIAVPSHSFSSILETIRPYLTKSHRLCWATKGLEEDSQQLLHQVVEQHLGQQHATAVLSGPSFAKEVANNLPTAVTIASPNESYSTELAALFHSDTFRVYTSQDMVGVQIGGACKNVIAIAAGIADGLGFGANTRAALITRGLAEITRLGVALGGQMPTFLGLAGLGDLVLTCTDDQSRNRRFGRLLANSKSPEEAKVIIGQVVEGATAASQVLALARKHNVEMPISEQVANMLAGHCTPAQAVHALLSRELKPEGT